MTIIAHMKDEDGNDVVTTVEDVLFIIKVKPMRCGENFVLVNFMKQDGYIGSVFADHFAVCE